MPPRIITVYNTSSTTLKATWHPVPEHYHFGQLLGYRVFYKDTTTTNTSDYENLDVGPDAQEANITGLNMYRKYIVQVAAFNRRGEGKPSKGVIISTDEDGKFLALYLNPHSFILTQVFYLLGNEFFTGTCLGEGPRGYGTSPFANKLFD